MQNYKCLTFNENGIHSCIFGVWDSKHRKVINQLSAPWEQVEQGPEHLDGHDLY